MKVELAVLSLITVLNKKKKCGLCGRKATREKNKKIYTDMRAQELCESRVSRTVPNNSP